MTSMFKKRAILLPLLLLFLIGCIEQREMDCSVLRLKFSYTINRYFEDQIQGEIRAIQVYVFDSNTGILVDILPVNEAAINRGYIEIHPPGDGNSDFTFVAWGVCGTDIRGGGYKTVEMYQPVAHARNEVQIGRTTLQTFRKMMQYTDVQARSTQHGEIMPSNVLFDHLFHSRAVNVPIRSSTINVDDQVIPLDFMRNTATLQIEVQGIHYLNRVTVNNPPRVFVTGRNERFNYDNSVGFHTRQLFYSRPNRTVTETYMRTDIKVQRMVIDRHLNTEGGIFLHLHQPYPDTPVMRPLDVVAAILSARDTHGNLLWPTQDAIDREKEFPITIIINQRGQVTVKIKEWILVDLDVGLA